MTKSDNEILNDYKLELYKFHEKSQDSFEKQLSYISAGGLGLSMVFIEKIVKNISRAENKWMLAVCWGLLGLTLVVNLISHLISARFTYKTIDDIEKDQFDYATAVGRNKLVIKINIASVIALLVGILFLILFVTTNLYR